MIVFRDVTFSFDHSLRAAPIIERLSLTILSGEFHVVLGPSGCGKTTALNMLAGFELPTAGTIQVDGHEVTGPGPDRVVIFQGDDSLYSWLTAIDNVEIGLRIQGVKRGERRARALDYLKLVGLGGHEHKYPDQLSGGMKQRVQIARALVCDSPVLLLDEPFGALDAQTRLILQGELARIWGETRKSVFFITHDISEAILLADRVSVMRAGPRSNIKETFEINIDRPRSPADPAFSRHYRLISDCLAAEVRDV
jgi:NitT/TauT family transport system ATP-binding protein